MNNRKKITRQGSGRTKGSYSFVSIPLSVLTAKFADTNTPIVIGRKFAEAVGIQAVSAAANVITNKIIGKTSDTAIAVKIKNLDDDAPAAPAAVVAVPALETK